MKEFRLGMCSDKEGELTYRTSNNQVVTFLLTDDRKRMSVVYQTKTGKYDWVDLDKGSTATLGGRLLSLSKGMRDDS